MLDGFEVRDLCGIQVFPHQNVALCMGKNKAILRPCVAERPWTKTSQCVYMQLSKVVFIVEVCRVTGAHIFGPGLLQMCLLHWDLSYLVAMEFGFNSLGSLMILNDPGESLIFPVVPPSEQFINLTKTKLTVPW